MDAKIQGICQRVKKERLAKRRSAAEKKKQKEEEKRQSAEGGTEAFLFPSDWGTEGEEVARMLVSGGCSGSASCSWGEVEMEGRFEIEDDEGYCSLAKMPSFDPDLIWEILSR